MRINSKYDTYTQNVSFLIMILKINIVSILNMIRFIRTDRMQIFHVCNYYRTFIKNHIYCIRKFKKEKKW